jgi:ATP-dependent Clp protease ATP-binding subunit ClpB
MSNFDYTDKAAETIAAAGQLAKDYANAQVHPAHIAFVLLNEGSGDPSVPGGLNGGPGTSLFSSVIQKAGGDPVSSSSLLCSILSDLYRRQV